MSPCTSNLTTSRKTIGKNCLHKARYIRVKIISIAILASSMQLRLYYITVIPNIHLGRSSVNIQSRVRAREGSEGGEEETDGRHLDGDSAL